MTSDLPELRASHADRDRAVETLRIAGGDGRLTTEELEDRLETALSARTVAELAALTADLPAGGPVGGAAAAKDLLVVKQHGSRYVRTGRWVVPKRIELRTQLCQVTLDFAEAVISPGTLRIDVQMVHGKLLIVTAPGVEIDADGLTLTYSKCKLRPARAGADPRLRIELAGTLLHAKVIERWPRRGAAGQALT
jgi:Domain of unknown function (DUF1707)